MNEGEQDYANKTETQSQGENVGISGTTSAHDGRKPSDLPGGSNKIVGEMKRAVSLEKLASNRRNALKSTGPKTSGGKKRVSRNAIRHGFYSKWLLIQHPIENESQDEYDELHADIFKHYRPVGWLEERWVEVIAVWSWRLRRLIRQESGLISRALAEHSHDLQQSRVVDPEFVPSSNPEMDAMTDHLFLASEGMENRLRYEALINRQLNHAIAEIERLQALPRGESVAT
jgi:hypothetical protein